MPTLTDGIYRFRFKIPQDAIDENGHVNNVAFVQWMQEAAIRHFTALGGTPLTAELGATWVVRSHQIEYLGPAFVGEELEVLTWIVDARRVRSTRRYQFRRVSDARLLVKGETEWVFVSAADGRPLTIPESITSLFHLVEEPPI